MPDLALFDFDGTITSEDTFAPFIHFAVTASRKAVGTAFLSPLLAAYKLGLYPATRMRASVAGVGFRGRRADDIRELGAVYARNVLPTVVRPDALQRIEWHKTRGDTVVVVSASLDAYLTHWCAGLGLDLICTELEARGGILTGRYHQGDCTGAEKARRVCARYDVGSYPVVYAYGDTHEDEQLLGLASKRYFRGQEVVG